MDIKSSLVRKKYYLKHREKLLKRVKEYQLKNKEKIKEHNLNRKDYLKEYRLKNKKKYEKYHIEYRLKNKKFINKRNEKYYYRNKEAVNKRNQRWKLKNKEQLKIMGKKYRSKNKYYWNLYVRNRRKIDIGFRFSMNLRRRILLALKGVSKSAKTMELLGVKNISEVKRHLEKQFEDGMTWDNHGLRGWHIDHIRPCASFDLRCPIGQLDCFHYTNLQPLWAHDNLSKGDKLLDIPNKL